MLDDDSAEHMGDIADAERANDEMPPLPRDTPLSRLLRWVREYDPQFQGLSDEEIFIRACGDEEEGLYNYAEACRMGECVLTRAFCTARMNKLARETLRESRGDEVPLQKIAEMLGFTVQ